MTKLISSCIKGIGALVKTTLVAFLLILALVSLLSLSFSGQLSTAREETGSTQFISQIELLQQELDQAKQGRGIQLRGELCFLGELIVIGCDSDTIFVSEEQFNTITSGQIIASHQVDGLLGKLGLAEFRLIVV